MIPVGHSGKIKVMVVVEQIVPLQKEVIPLEQPARAES